MAALALAGAVAAAPGARAQYVLNITQQGSDIVALGSGSIDLAGLYYAGEYGGYPAGYIVDDQQALQNVHSGTSSTSGIVYSGLNGPGYFLSSGNVDEMTTEIGSGESVGIVIFGGTPLLAIDANYVSGTPISSSATFDDATFAEAGLIDGTYVWTWDNGAGSFTIDVEDQVPEPASLSLLAGGVLAAAAARALSRQRPMRALTLYAA